MNAPKIAILATAGENTNILYHALAGEFQIATIIIEDKPSPWTTMMRRCRRLGWARVAGQVLFQLFVPPILRRTSRRRREEILAQHGMNTAPPPQALVHRVRSANDSMTLDLLRRSGCAVVAVCGTRILTRELINSSGRPLINWHAGITPLYRGVHGGYWALVNGDRRNCGVTVHRIDAGVDTGPILDQAGIDPGPADCFVTYPLLQLAAALPLLKKALIDTAAGSVRTRKTPDGPSRLWYHPTLLEYLWHRVRRGVR